MADDLKPDISRINTRLWCGADLSIIPTEFYEQVRWLLRYGIGTIIDFRTGDEGVAEEHEALEECDLKVIHLPTEDKSSVHEPWQWWAQLIDRTRAELVMHDEGVLLMCHMGVNRAPSGTYAVVRELYGGTLIRTWGMIHRRRKVAYAAQAPDYLRSIGKEADAVKLEQYINKHFPAADVNRVIRAGHKLDKDRLKRFKAGAR